MAISGKTAPDEIPYALATDKPPDVPALSKAMADRLQALRTVRSSLINTEESRTNTAYGTLTTPDEIKVPVNAAGLLVIEYAAEIESSVAAAGRIALFINGTQVARYGGGASVQVEGSSIGTGWCFVTTAPDKMNISEGPVGVATSALLLLATGTTGGPMFHGVPAGEYTVTARYKATSGTITAKNRRLYGYGIC
jgi:hypothetical protein